MSELAPAYSLSAGVTSIGPRAFQGLQTYSLTSPMSPTVPPLTSAPAQIGPPRQSTGPPGPGLSGGGSILSRPQSVPTLNTLSPRQPTFVSPRTLSPTNRPSGTATPSASLTLPLVNPSVLQPVTAIPNGSSPPGAGSVLSPASRGDNGPSSAFPGLRSVATIVTPPVTARSAKELQDPNRTSVRVQQPFRSEPLRASKSMSSVALPASSQGPTGARSVQPPATSAGPVVYQDALRHAREVQEREGKNFAAATKLLIQTEQQLATALSEAEALKRAERQLGEELSEANASSKAEERLLSEISDAKAQLQASQADSVKLRANDAMLRTQVANQGVQLSELEAKFQTELQEARKFQEIVEVERAELTRVREVMERYRQDASNHEADALEHKRCSALLQEETTQTAAKLIQLEADLVKARELPGAMQTEHTRALEVKDAEIADHIRVATEFEAKLHNEAVSYANERSEVEQRHALELARARAETEAALAEVQRLRTASPSKTEGADVAAMNASLQQAARRVETLSTEHAQASALANKHASDLQLERQNVGSLTEQLLRARQELETMRAAQEAERKQRDSILEAYETAAKRIADLEGMLRTAEKGVEDHKRSLEMHQGKLSDMQQEVEKQRFEAQSQAGRSRELEMMLQEASGAGDLQTRPVQFEQFEEVQQLRLELAEAQRLIQVLQVETSAPLAVLEAELAEACSVIETLRSDAVMLQLAKVAGEDRDRPELTANGGLSEAPERFSAKVSNVEFTSMGSNVSRGIDTSMSEYSQEDYYLGPQLNGRTPAQVFYNLTQSCEDYIRHRLSMNGGQEFLAQYTFMDGESYAPRRRDSEIIQYVPDTKKSSGSTNRMKSLARWASCCQAAPKQCSS